VLRAPGGGRPAGVGSALLQLQRDRGNRYVQGVISRARSGGAGPPSSSSHQRSAVAGAAAGAVDPSLQRAIEGSRRGGRALDQRTATELGGALGREVSQVRVHDDDQADRLSRSLHAAAFTIGRDIFFRAGHYDPGTTPGRRLLAHELAHVAQQQEACLRTAHRHRLDLAPADDPGERAADRAADDMVLRGRAQPMTMTPQAPLIQRKAFIGWDPLSAKRAIFGGSLKDKPTRKKAPRQVEDVEEEQGRARAKDVPEKRGRARRRSGDVAERRGRARPGAEDLPRVTGRTGRFVRIPYELGDLGTGERNLALILMDYKSRYFRSLGELYRYVRRETDHIGYVDREKVWVRLPEMFLVLGEHHDKTTVMDLVEATGLDRYIYEGAATRPSPHLDPGSVIPEMEHQLEEKLPKYVVGLIGVQRMLAEKLSDLERHHGWKSEIRGERPTAERTDPEAEKQQYQAELAKWSYEWEAKYQSMEERGERKLGPGGGGYVGQRKLIGGLSDQPPFTPYDRSRTEVRVTLQVLQSIRDVARGKNDPITLFYDQYRPIIDKTIAQLEEGLPVELTRMFLKMATGKFDLKGLIKLLSTAAVQELAELKVYDVATDPSYSAGKYSGPTETRAEELRDSYMLHRIVEAKAKGYRLAGLGDAHRSRLQGVLQAMDPDILVQSWTDFYLDQYRLHPDRD